jgi:glycosyltransferase involved in cell wall biosynthesis
VKSISVVIPVRNEEAIIEACIASVQEDDAVCEVIVVDGGSSDETVSRAQAAGARVLTHDQPVEFGGGRGGQNYAGVMAATGEVVAIVHADTRLEEGALTRVVEILQQKPGVVGGAVGCVFDGQGWRLRLLDVANHFRAAVLGISFGDQVQFFRRAAVVDLDCYPNIPLMEDVELSLRLRRLGRRVYLFGGALASPRSWERGAGKRAVLVIGLVAEYLWKRLWGKPDALAMYRRYYGGKG